MHLVIIWSMTKPGKTVVTWQEHFILFILDSVIWGLFLTVLFGDIMYTNATPRET